MTRRQQKRALNRALRAWSPSPKIRIKIADLPCMISVKIHGIVGPCFACKAKGMVTRAEHPYAIRLRGTKLDWYPCELCYGTGIYTPRTTVIEAMPKCFMNKRKKHIKAGQ